MDPVSQGTLGAIAGQSATARASLAKAALIGAMAGMAPDLDVFIHSKEDPLLSLEFHRQFSHSLFFIPIGGFLCAVAIYGLFARRWKMNFGTVFGLCTLGYGTHGLLDGCTSYGTQLLWPLSNERFAWDVISIIDPLFTVPLIGLAALAARQRRKRWVAGAWIWMGFYLALGFIQQQRAVALAETIAQIRGHTAERLTVKPSFANLWVWKALYEYNGYYYVMAVKPGGTQPMHWDGEKIAKLEIDRDLPWLDGQSQQALDIERFRWFSADYIAIDSNDPLRVIDVRYSLLPDQVKALWGIALREDANADQHVRFFSQRDDTNNALSRLWRMMSQNP